VRVSLVGEPKQWAFGVLALISGDHKSAAMEFESVPGFLRAAIDRGVEIGLNTSGGTVTLLLVRENQREP
jgi:hypothetical protein